MTMADTPTLALAAAAGAVLGAVFFGGLWWTVRKGLAAPQPALWFLGSLALRMAIVLPGFYFLSGGQWQRLLAGLLGFMLVRFIVMRLAGPLIGQDRLRGKEAGHAP